MKTHQCHQHSYPNLIKKELPKAKKHNKRLYFSNCQYFVEI